MINVRLVNVSPKIRAFTVKNDDDSFTICVNDNIGYEERIKAYQHELHHIENGDFDNAEDKDVQQIEATAHGISSPIFTEKDSKQPDTPAAEVFAFEVERQQRLKQIRRRRKRLARDMAEMDKRIDWLMKEKPGYFDKLVDKQYDY